MKIPKTTTIKKRIRFYAYRAGFTLHPHYLGSIPSGIPGAYSLFDIKAGYYTHRNIGMNDVVRVVTDELYAMEYAAKRQLC